MITVSVCMIVKNEEDKLDRCLSSVKDIVDEMIIVDTGSTDSTKEIVKNYTTHLFDFPWIDDFSAARNFSFEKATMDYILWLDADDIVLPEDIERFKELKRTLSPDVDVVMMRYNTSFDEHGRVTFTYFRERLTKRACQFKWREPVHECLQIGGNIINSDVCITHMATKKESSTRNLKIYERMLEKNIGLSPRSMYYYARELMDNKRYADALRQFHLFLDTGLGWVEDHIHACSELAKCYQIENSPQKALKILFRSFEYDLPRANICCQIGYHFKEKENYPLAIFWFELASNLEKPTSSWGFYQEEYWGFIPFIECAVCYDRIGKFELAEFYNEKAAACKPDSPAVLYNRKYFEERRENASNANQ